MGGGVRILITGSEVGPHSAVLPLNASFRPDVPLLKLQVDIDWSPSDPVEALTVLEDRLVELCPGLRQHQCRGHVRYRILRAHEAGEVAQAPIEASLALAHLLEHVLIDAMAFIVSAPLLSGITGALEDSEQRFDIFVECPDPSVAPVTVRLAVSWVSALLEGTSLDGRGRQALELVHLLYERRSEGLPVEEIVQNLGRAPEEVHRTLLWLEQNGFARKQPPAKKSGKGTYYKLLH
jgi:hypothetical protein